MNDFSEGVEVVGLGREFQRDNTLVEKKFKDELILEFTSERILRVGHSSRIIQISLQYIPAVDITDIVDQLIDH